MKLFNVKCISLLLCISITSLLNQSCTQDSKTPIDDNNANISNSIDQSNDTSLVANAGENQTVESSAIVNLTGTTDKDNSVIVTSLWQRVSGPEIIITEPSNSSINFTAPEVKTTEVIVLSYTASGDAGSSSRDEIEITVIPTNSTNLQRPSHVLLFTEDRIAHIKEKIANDTTAWDAMTKKIADYYKAIPYNSGEYAGAFALAYYISGEKKYIERTIELLNHAYFDEPDIGWKDYSSRNSFRSNARWAVMGYSWIKDFITPQEQVRIENILKLWSEYWLKHVDYDNDFNALRVDDTDDVTSITKNLTLLGYVLSDSDNHRVFGEKVLNVADTLLERYVVGYYMQDIMKGGAWAEGSDYSPATQMHWIETFIINKDQRGIEFPTNYAKLAMESLLHQTLSGGTGVYKYGSEETAVDYDDLSGDYRYEFALSLMSILEDENDLALINQWLNKIIDKEGFKSGSMVTHMDRLLYHDPTISAVLPIKNLKTLHYAEGVGLVASRNNWGNKATNLYFINRQIRVDHEHKDALSFDIAYNGVWITKETTGYAGASESSIAHNTILIENADGGSSSPTRRPAGVPKYYSIHSDDYVTLISAGATKTYNMSGYFATDYALQVNRQIAFIKPNIVIVYDHIVTDKNQIRDLAHYSDLNLSAGMQHTRWVKLIQHTQAEPSLINNNHNSYQVEAENRLLAYQVILPNNATVKIIDEKELWQNSLEYEIPQNQKRWHFEVSTPSPKQENEFITTLSFGDSNETTINQLLLDPVVMTKENAYIKKGNVIGLAIQAQQNKYIILFNKNPEQTIEHVEINKPAGFKNTLVYAVGFTVN